MKSTYIFAVLNKLDYKNYIDQAITFDKYHEEMKGHELMNEVDEHLKYIPINLQRTKRLLKTVQLAEEILATVKLLHHKVYWLVLTEHWCGDSAQILPVMNQVALASKGRLELKILYRDEHPDLMETHLTNGSKSIPKLIQLDSKFGMNAVWGPRPNVIQKLVTQWKSDPEIAEQYSEKLHAWYAADKTVAIQKDLLKLLKIAVAFCPECIAR